MQEGKTGGKGMTTGGDGIIPWEPVDGIGHIA